MLTTEQLKARAESLGLNFFIEQRAGIWVKEWLNDGCTSATAEEVMMWSMLANQEVQPVMYASEETLAYAKEGEKSLVTWSEPMNDAVVPLFTAPPAPAVPEEMPRQHQNGWPLDYSDYANGWNACRAAMLVQPVSQGYKLPEGWKPVPVEPTAEMINAALASGALSIRTTYRVMLAAAPEQSKPADHVWVKCAVCGYTTHQHFDHCGVHCGEVMAAPEGGK